MKDDIWSSMLHATATMEDPLHDFAIMLIYYTSRALTDQNDILRAMSGIIRRLSEKARCRFLEGLPTAGLDIFVLFRSFACTLHRRRGFPTYSWTGWKGPIHVVPEAFRSVELLNKWLEEDTWIIWYKRSPSGVTSLVWDLAANESFPLNDRTYSGYRQRRPFQWPSLSVATSRTYPTEDLRFELPPCQYPRLQFWSLSLYLMLRLENVLVGTANVFDRNWAEVGNVELDGLDENGAFESQRLLEFVLLSRVFTLGEEAEYWVMLIEWNDHVAERRGLGKIDKSAIDRSWAPGPTWKEFILE